MRKLLLIFLSCISALGAISAQEATDSIRIYYRQGYRYVESSYRGNKAELDRFVALISEAREQGRFERILIYSYTSPEGTNASNERLSELRADSLKAYIGRHAEIPSEKISTNAEGIAWAYLRNMVEESDMEYRDEVLEIIDGTPEFVYDDSGRIVDGRRKRLMDLGGGLPYNYMLENFFPDLRTSIALVMVTSGPETEKPVQQPATSSEPEHKPAAGTGRQEEPEDATPADTPTQPPVADAGTKEHFQPVIAIKTNLLYWGTVMPDFHSYTFVPNLEIEWFFCDRWSLAGTGNYAKWAYGGDDFFGISSWSLEPRLWFGSDGSFRWLYLGLYGQAGDYDVQNDRLERDGNTGKIWGTGLSLGVAIPFSDRLGLEVGIRGGYRNSSVRAYSYEAPDYFLDYESKDGFWGVTGIKASLYFRFGKGSK